MFNYLGSIDKPFELHLQFNSYSCDNGITVSIVLVLAFHIILKQSMVLID